MRRRIAGAVAAISFIAAAVAWIFVPRTYHLATVQDGVLYRDGARSVNELATAVQRVRAKTVVSLVDEAELQDPNKPQFQAEASYMGEHGVHYQRIPVKLGGWPRSEDIQEFLRTAQDPTSRPVLLHCAQGVRRTAMFVAAYQESVLGYDKAKARAAIISFGHSDRTIDDINHFIDLYEPRTRTFTNSEQN